VCDFRSDLLHIAGAIWCICDLLSDKNYFLTFFCTKLQMRFGVRFRVRCRALPLHAPNRTAKRTANRMVRVNGSNSVSDTKLQMQQISSAIYSKSNMKLHTCNQPLRREIGQKIEWQYDSLSDFPSDSNRRLSGSRNEMVCHI
jgi:hypothetical protein